MTPSIPCTRQDALVELIDDLARCNAHLATAAAIWQTRAARLENQLKRFTAGRSLSVTGIPALSQETRQSYCVRVRRDAAERSPFKMSPLRQKRD